MGVCASGERRCGGDNGAVGVALAARGTCDENLWRQVCYAELRRVRVVLVMQ